MTLTEREQREAFMQDVQAFQQKIAPGITFDDVWEMTNKEIDEQLDRVLSDERDRVRAEIVQRFRNYSTLERKSQAS